MANDIEDGIYGGVDFGAYYGPLCRSKQHLMDAGNTWIAGDGGTRCRACYIASTERYAELRKAS